MRNEGANQTTYGYELLWVSNEKYSGKILVFEAVGNKTDMIFHKEKSKSIFVNAGQIKLRWIDTTNGTMMESVLDEGKTANIAQLQPHQIEAIVANTSITEVGSAELENDTFVLISNSATT
jgi:hypothetical protein